MTPDEIKAAVQAAFVAGQSDQRLSNIEQHGRALNGSIEKQANALEALLVVVTALAARVSLAARIGALFLGAWVTAMTYLLLHVR